MPEFISKVQHKYYEKGDFTDEKVRSLDETIQLIKAFPWNEERGSDVQLTGPSIAMKDECSNYLKVALYFNGKYCLYYLDSDGHLYEYHASELNEACDIVTQFFGGQVPLQSFEKHLFGSGAKSHFETRSFEYRINGATAFFTILFWAVFSTFYLAFAIVLCFAGGLKTVVPGIFSLLISLLLCQRLYFTFRMYLKAKNMFINIRSSSGSFTYG